MYSYRVTSGRGRLPWTGAGQNMPQPFGKPVPSSWATALASCRLAQPMTAYVRSLLQPMSRLPPPPRRSAPAAASRRARIKQGGQCLICPVLCETRATGMDAMRCHDSDHDTSNTGTRMRRGDLAVAWPCPYRTRLSRTAPAITSLVGFMHRCARYQQPECCTEASRLALHTSLCCRQAELGLRYSSRVLRAAQERALPRHVRHANRESRCLARQAIGRNPDILVTEMLG